MAVITVRTTLSGVADATGAATITYSGPGNKYLVASLICAGGLGATLWTATGAGNSPLGTGTGAAPAVGPFMLKPSETLTLSITNAAHGAPLMVSLSGVASFDPAELPSGAPVSVSISGPLPLGVSVTPLPLPVNISNPSSVPISLPTGSGSLGDVGAPALTADSATETITTAGSNPFTSIGLASFKAASISVPIAVVGVLGAFIQVAATLISPAFGQATTAGNLLVAWVTTATTDVATTAPGWVKVLSAIPGGGPRVTIWARPNCGATELAPVFTQGVATNLMYAQLAEFSGAATVTPQDVTSSALTSGVVATIHNAVPDSAFGDLVLLVTRWNTTGTATATFSETFNNGAAVVHAGDSGSFADARYSSFSYGIIPAAVAALPLGVRPWAYDAFGSAAPAINTVASVVLPAVVGKRYIATFLDASLVTNAVAGAILDVQLLDGVTVIFTHQLAVGAAIDASTPYSESGLAIPGTTGNSMTWRFGGTAASLYERVSIGAYLQ
jgi:hypothetical protein